jgi:hypothetical protein
MMMQEGILLCKSQSDFFTLFFNCTLMSETYLVNGFVLLVHERERCVLFSVSANKKKGKEDSDVFCVCLTLKLSVCQEKWKWKGIWLQKQDGTQIHPPFTSSSRQEGFLLLVYSFNKVDVVCMLSNFRKQLDNNGSSFNGETI